MPTLQERQKNAELQKTWEILSSKIERLKTAHASENDVSAKFKLEQEIAQVEQERTGIERQMQDLERRAAPEQAPVVPGCSCDIFVSYAPEDDAQQWISTTLDNFRKFLEVSFSAGQQFPVWQAHDACTPDALAAFTHSAAALLFVSSVYLRSAWCQTDNSPFAQAIRQRIANGGKLFLIELERVERPAMFSSFGGYPFYAQEGQIARALALPGVSNPDSLKYRTQLFQVCNDLSDELQRLRKRAAIRQQLANAGLFLDHHAQNGGLAGCVSKKINERGVAYILPYATGDKLPSEARQEFEETVLENDGVLVVYGAAPPNWLIMEINHLRKIFAKNNRTPPKAFGIYDGPPETNPVPPTLIFPGQILNCRGCPQPDQGCQNCPGEVHFMEFIERLKA